MKRSVVTAIALGFLVAACGVEEKQDVKSADEWLAESGGDLLLGEMVDALGRRAEDLAELWNAWGQVRPVLLAVG